MHMRRGLHMVSFWDGCKLHNDGSPFYDVNLFSNQKKMNIFVKELKLIGYTPE